MKTTSKVIMGSKDPVTGREVKLEMEEEAENPALCIYLKIPGMSGFIRAEEVEKLATLLTKAAGSPVFQRILERQGKED